MMKILDNRTNFYQWDLEQKLIVEDSTITEVHFSNKTEDNSLVCEVYEQDGKRVVNVPNIMLTEAWDIIAYAYCNDLYTKQSKRFKVIARTKPADYVYTETEVKNWEDLEARIEALEAGGGSAIKDGQLLLDNGLDIRTTNPNTSNAPSSNYIKIGKNLDTDSEILAIKGWDINSTFSQNEVELKCGNSKLSVSKFNTTELIGENNINIQASIVNLGGNDIQVTRLGSPTPNSIISKSELDSTKRELENTMASMCSSITKPVKLLSTTVTQAAFDEANGEIKIISVGDENKTFDGVNQIRILIYLPMSNNINTANGRLTIRATANAGDSLAPDNTILLRGNGAGESITLLYEKNQNLSATLDFIDNKFVQGICVKNLYGSYTYGTSAYGWTNSPINMADKKYIHIRSHDNKFKFPVGTKVEVYGR